MTCAWPSPQGASRRDVFWCPAFVEALNGQCLAVIWRRRVIWQDDARLMYEARWHPKHGNSESMSWPSGMSATRVDAYRQAGRALLLALAPVGGRPPAFEDEVFPTIYIGTYRRLLDESLRDGTRLPTKTEVATAMGISTKTFKRARDRHHLSFPPPL
jgi:hypothetical protein